MKYILILLVSATFLFSACGGDDTPTTPAAVEEAKDYSGVWNGSFEGGDEGFLEMTVKSDNKMTGRGFSTNISSLFSFEGALETNGNLPGAESNFKTTFTGQFSDSTAEGTWTNTNGSIKGTWFLER